MPSVTVNSLVREPFLLGCYNYFLRLSGFPDLFGNVFLINLKLIFNLFAGGIQTKQVFQEI